MVTPAAHRARQPLPRLLTGLSAFWIACLLATQVQALSLTSQVDRHRLAAGETLQLNVRADQRVGQAPDFSALEQHFDILRQGQSLQLRMINGRAESFTEWQLTLAPKREGTLLIPSFELNGAFSEAIEITVTETSASARGNRQSYAELVVDDDQVYVGQQVLLTLRIVTAVNLHNLEQADWQPDHAEVVNLGNSRYERVINGARHAVFEQRYALFPQRAGNLELPPVTVTATTSPMAGLSWDPFNRGQLLRLRTEAQTLSVAPPPSQSAQPFLPARDIALHADWEGDPQQARVGEPLTLTLTLRAEGLTANQLPPLQIPEHPALKHYPEPPQQDQALNDLGVTAERRLTVAYIPQQPGTVTLPGQRIPWWDTQADQLRYAQLPAQTLRIAGTPPGGGGSPSSTAAQPADPAKSLPGDTPPMQPPTTGATWWPWVTAAALLLAAVFAGLWWRERQRPAVPTAATAPRPATVQVSEKLRWQQLQQAARANEPAALHRALLAWAQTRWPHATGGVPSLAERLPPEQRAPLLQLDAHLFAGDTPAPDPDHIVTAVKPLRDSGDEATPSGADLPTLYPSR